MEKQVDESPKPASSISSADYTHINEKSLLRKLDWRLLPGVSLLYLVSFLDRSNVANARLDGLVTDLHMTGNEYLTGLTVFFIGYISLEVVWNLILKKIGPRIWLPAVTIVWGIVTTLQGILVNKVGFFVIRTALGVAEGALFPGVSKLGEHRFMTSGIADKSLLAGGILPFNVVQERREDIQSGVVLLRCIFGGCFWWHPGICMFCMLLTILSQLY